MIRGKALPLDRPVEARDELDQNQVECDDVQVLEAKVVIVEIPDHIPSQPQETNDFIRVVGDRRTYETNGPRQYRQALIPKLAAFGRLAIPVYRDKL